VITSTIVDFWENLVFFHFFGQFMTFFAFYARKVRKKMVYIRERWMNV
jgi:hypothetical protein